MYLGTGVSVTSIERIRDEFVDSQLQTEQQNMSNLETLETNYTRLESIFNEPSETGLGDLLNKFYDSWQDLANEPTSLLMRDFVVSNAEMLTNKFHTMNSQLNNLSNDIYQEYVNQIEQFNSITQQLADINVLLGSAETENVQSASILDQRDALLTDLSKLADVKVSKNQSGQVMLSLDSKVFLERTTVTTMSEPPMGTSLAQIKWSEGSSNYALSGGSLGALVDFHDDVIPSYQEQLDHLAVGVATSTNKLHSQGYGLDGSTNTNFFTASTSGAADIRVNNEILSNKQKVAASSDENMGNGDLALQISQLSDMKLIPGDSFNSKNLLASSGMETIVQQLIDENFILSDTMSFTDYYANIIFSVGQDTLNATVAREGQEMYVQQLKTTSESVSGVSLDEEMTNLIKYQQAYQASAKLVNLADELAETVLNLV